jgi:protoporphyrin/coproporphyrin ferrochelatase
VAVGVLLMAYGTPATPDDVEAYYTHVRRGRPPTPELLDDLARRYRAIGGESPLLARTRAQADGVQRALDAAEPGRFLVALGMKHAPPFVEDGVARLCAAGVTSAIGVVLAPHYSALSVGEYVERARAAAGGVLPMEFVEHWHEAPGYLDALARRVKEALADFPEPDGVDVVFTAHSLPARILESGDPYPEQLQATAAAVADRAGVARWSVAWQSAGRTPEPWIGPSLHETMQALAAAGSGAVLVCPAGFVSDHLEVLYDLDVEARGQAAELGLAFNRTASLNDDPQLCTALASVVLRRVGRG